MTWSSVRAKPTVSPSRWFQMEADGAIMLKDTRNSPYYTNYLVTPTTFTYQLPPRPRGDEVEVYEELQRQSTLALAAKRDVKIMSVCNAANHYLGEFVVETFTKGVFPPQSPAKPFVTLKRKERQSSTIRQQLQLDRQVRSKSEATHSEELLQLFPASEWIIAHEPETVMNLDTPLVSNGMMQSFAGDNYTIDFIVHSIDGCRRVCVESKYVERDLLDNESAMIKCRQLRDKALCRVLGVYGHGQEIGFYDFGPPRQAKECKFRRDELDRLRDLLCE